MTLPGPTTTPFDRSGLLSKCDGDAALFRHVIALFLDDYGSQIQVMREALARGDIDRLYSVTHSIKGAVSHFGAGRAVAAAMDVEGCCRRGDRSGAAARADELIAAVEELAGCLRADPALE